MITYRYPSTLTYGIQYWKSTLLYCILFTNIHVLPDKIYSASFSMWPGPPELWQSPPSGWAPSLHASPRDLCASRAVVDVLIWDHNIVRIYSRLKRLYCKLYLYTTGFKYHQYKVDILYCTEYIGEGTQNQWILRVNIITPPSPSNPNYFPEKYISKHRSLTTGLQPQDSWTTLSRMHDLLTSTLEPSLSLEGRFYLARLLYATH